MRIGEIMNVRVATLEPDDSIVEAARKLRDARVGFAPVVSNGTVLGVLTDRDIVVRAVAAGFHTRVARVLDILTPGSVHCTQDTDVADAAKLMVENHVHRLIVLNGDNKLAGVLSLSDIAAHAGETAKVVEEILRTSPFVDMEAETSMRGAGVSETGDLPARGGARIGTLARRELSAVETYRLALGKVGREAGGEELLRIEREHEEAVGLLLESLRRRGEAPPRSSGLRGRWSKAVEGASLMLGRGPALRALRNGEARGLNDYENALRDDALDPEVKELIRGRLLPRAREHIPALERLLAAERP
ncbi:MAG: CBS domain-containing protein [Elusimicrobiota bacterium]|nr:CBS domain-containing protein [Elusimicrobiota bacterium]